MPNDQANTIDTLNLDNGFFSTDAKTIPESELSPELFEEPSPIYNARVDDSFGLTPSTPETEPEESPAVAPQSTETASPAPKVDTHNLAQLQKVERRLAKKVKEAEQRIQDAAKYQKAFTSGNIREALQELGEDPARIYRELTNQILANDVKPENKLSPIEQELLEQKRITQEYAQRVEKLHNDIQTEKQDKAYWNAINNVIAPELNANEDNYEAAILYCKGKEEFAKQVLQGMYEAYQETGESPNVAEIAKAYDDYYSDLLEQGLKLVKPTKRFQSYFQDARPEESKKEALQDKYGHYKASEKIHKQSEVLAFLNQYQKENPGQTAEDTNIEPPKTLTNNMSFPTPKSNPYGKKTKDQQIAEFLKSQNLK